MKTRNLLFISLFSIASVAADATPTLVIGTPANSYLAKPSAPSPLLGGTLVNFDNFTPGLTIDPPNKLTYAYGGYTQAYLSSPDQLVVEPFSTQSAPNELFDNSGNGTADIFIVLAFNVKTIAVGIADSDPVSITLNLLTNSGTVPFAVNIANTGDPNNPGNGYYFLYDTVPDIYGLEILQTSASPNYSGLAIDDLQFAPEPTTVALFGVGGLVLAGLQMRKRA